jgi:hypothetical protein
MFIAQQHTSDALSHSISYLPTFEASMSSSFSRLPAPRTFRVNYRNATISRLQTCFPDVRDLVPDSIKRAKATLTFQANLDPNTGNLRNGRVHKAMLSIDFPSLSTSRLSVDPDAEASNQIEGTSRAPFRYRGTGHALEINVCMSPVLAAEYKCICPRFH